MDYIKCENSESRNEKFMYSKNPRPYCREKTPNVLVHGLLRCKSCSCTWNRDVNGSKNIFKVALAAIKEESRPEWLCRTKISVC